jgi:hypothetical protein
LANYNNVPNILKFQRFLQVCSIHQLSSCRHCEKGEL